MHPNDMNKAQLDEAVTVTLHIALHLKNYFTNNSESVQKQLDYAHRLTSWMVYIDMLYPNYTEVNALLIEGNLPDLSLLSRDELRALLSDLGFLSLDLTQHFDCAANYLKEEYKVGALKAGAVMVAELFDLPTADLRDPAKINHGIAIFGGKGLEGWTA